VAHFPLTVVIPAEVAVSSYPESGGRERAALWAEALLKWVEERMAPFRDYEQDGDPRPFPCSRCEQQQWVARKSIQHEAIGVFGDWLIHTPTFVKRYGKPPEFPGVDASDDMAADAWVKYVEWLDRWGEFVGERREWIQAKLDAARREIRSACANCNGTGIEVRDYWSGKFDYAGARPRWAALNVARGVENAFIGGWVPFRPLAKSSPPGTFTPGAALKSLVPRSPFQIGTDLLLPNEGWTTMEPGLWGIYELPPEERHLSFYATDERWPLALSRHLPAAVADDDVCVALECHT
jgi:hypothetical protein